MQGKRPVLKNEYKTGLKAGLISGIIWGALMSFASLLEVQINYSKALGYYSGLYANDSSVFNGMTPVQYINYNLEFNTVLFIVVGVGFGALAGLLFVYISPKFLPRQSHIVKGLVLSVFLWLLYNLSLVAAIDPFELISSLAISLFGGYLLGFFLTRLSFAQRVISTTSKSSSRGAG